MAGGRGFPGFPGMPGAAPDVDDDSLEKAADAAHKEIHSLLAKVGTRGSFEFKPQNEYEEKGAKLNDAVQELKKKLQEDQDQWDKLAEFKLNKPLNELGNKIENKLVTDVVNLQQNLIQKLDVFNTELKEHFERWLQGEKFDSTEWNKTIEKAQLGVSAEYKALIDPLKNSIASEVAEQKRLKDLIETYRENKIGTPEQKAAIQAQVDQITNDITKSQHLVSALQTKITQLEKSSKDQQEELKAFQKKHILEEMNRLKQSIANQNTIAYSRKKADELGIRENWRKVGELKGDNEENEIGPRNSYTKKLKDGVYKRDGSDVTLAVKNGVVTAYGEQGLFGDKIPYEKRIGEAMDAMIVGMGMKEVEFEINNPEYLDIHKLGQAINLAASKNLKVKLGDNVLIALAQKDPAAYDRIVKAVQQINGHYKSHEERVVATRRDVAMDEQIQRIRPGSGLLEDRLAADRQYQVAKSAAEAKYASPQDKRNLVFERERVENDFKHQLRDNLNIDRPEVPDHDKVNAINREVGRDMIHLTDLKNAKQIFERNLLALQHDMKVNPNNPHLDAQYQKLIELGNAIDKKLQVLHLLGDVWATSEATVLGGQQPAAGEVRNAAEHMKAVDKMKNDIDKGRKELQGFPAQKAALIQQDQADKAEAKQNAARGLGNT